MNYKYVLTWDKYPVLMWAKQTYSNNATTKWVQK